MWFIGVELEQETSALPLLKKILDAPLHCILMLQYKLELHYSINCQLLTWRIEYSIEPNNSNCFSFPYKSPSYRASTVCSKKPTKETDIVWKQNVVRKRKLE